MTYRNIGLNVHLSILQYKQSYDNNGIQPPAYRITCKEHKALVEYLNPIRREDYKPSMIAEYYGIQIEVVMIVDPYL